MNVYVLIKTEMDEEFNFHTTVCGVYTKEGKEQFEKTIPPEKCKELKKRLRLAYERDIKNFQKLIHVNENDYPLNNVMDRKIEECRRYISTLDECKTDEQLRKFYMYQEGYSWQEELLVDV